MSISDAITIKLVVVGDGNVGKTCILLSYTTDKFPTDYIPTVFENYTTQATIDGQMINLSLWDTAGQETYNRLRTLSYNQADVFLIVFSVVEQASFENALNKWYPELNAEELKNVPKIFVGNKIDMRNESQPEHIKEESAKQTLKGDQFHCDYYECSALTQKGLKEIFDVAMRRAIKGKNMRSQAGQTLNSINNGQKDQLDTKEKGCCSCRIF